MTAHAQFKRIAAPFLDEIAGVAAELVRHGWAEANAGNLSLRIPGTGTGGYALLVKRAGVRMRDVARNPLAGLCLVSVTDGGRVTGVLPAAAGPSTELPSHVAVHNALLACRPSDRAVLHTHPTATIALGMLVPDGTKFAALLARMHSEGPLVLAGRMTVLPFSAPGSDELARATAAAVARTPGVIWPLHGMVATGPDLSAALDLVEVVDKAASIALSLGARRMLSLGLTPAQTRATRRAAGR